MVHFLQLACVDSLHEILRIVDHLFWPNLLLAEQDKLPQLGRVFLMPFAI